MIKLRATKSLSQKLKKSTYSNNNQNSESFFRRRKKKRSKRSQSNRIRKKIKKKKDDSNVLTLRWREKEHKDKIILACRFCNCCTRVLKAMPTHLSTISIAFCTRVSRSARNSRADKYNEEPASETRD